MANVANTIQIKRSGTSGAPSQLKLGELAYSYLTASGNPTANGGDRLFIGANGVNGGTGYANDVIVIGGKYFTDLLDHTRGTLTDSSAILTDSSSKIDQLLTTNLAIGGASGAGLDQTISVTNTNGNLVLSANGTGLVTISGTYGLVIPVGSNSNRGTGVQGEIRYNTSITGFEGYNGSSWSSLGGVRSVDGHAYITAETSPGAGDDTLHFYAGTSGSPGTSVNVGNWTTTTLTITNGLVNLTNATSNQINFGSNGLAPPKANGYSTGAKIVIFDNNTSTDTGLAIGAEAGYMWSGVDTGNGFKWYAGTTELLRLDETSLTLQQTTASTDHTTGALVVKGGAGIAGDLYVGGNIVGASNTSAQFFGDSHGFNALYAGYSTFTALPNNVLQLTANINDYAQTNFQNYNNGNVASVDYVATAANGTNYTGFIDMGIASGSYDGTQTGVLGPIVTANDGYLYVTGDTTTSVGGVPGVGVGNLIIGTTSTGSQVKIAVGTGSTNIHPTVVFNPYNTPASNTSSGAMIVSGGVGISGDLYVHGQISADTASFASINDTPIGNLTPSTGAFTTASANVFLAAEGAPNEYGNAGFSFQNDGGYDTGMFSSGDGNVTFYANNTVIASFNNNLSGLNWTFDTPVTFTNGGSGGYTLPTADGSNQYALTTNGSGTVSWTAIVNSITAGTNLNTTSSATTGDVTINLDTTLTGLTEVDVGNLILSGSAVSSTSSSGSVNINTSPDGSTIHNWEFNTDGSTAFNNAAYTFPAAGAGSGNDYYILTDATGNGTLSWVSTTLTINGDASTTSTLQLLSQSLTFAGDTGPVKVEVSNQTVTTTVDAATTTTLGLASFDSTYFTVTMGNATITSGSIGNDRLTNSTISGISLGSNLDDLTVGTNLNFDSGTTYNGGAAKTINLDSTLTGLTEVDVGNLVIATNDISGKLGHGTQEVVINTTASDGTTQYTYTFGADGNLNVAGKITNVTTPTADYDAANKLYVDSVAQGLHIHDPAQVATNDTLAVLSGGTITYDNGTSGVGASITLSTPLSMIDNYTLQDLDRILVKNETTTAYNGVYVWHYPGTILTRATDFDKPIDITGGDFVFVEHGTVGGSTGWVQTDQTLSIVGTNAITFKQFAGAGTYIAGAGLNLSGNSFSVNAGYGLDTSGMGNALELASSVAGDGLTYTTGVINVVGTTNRISVSADAIDISTSYVGQSSINTLGTVTTGTWHADTIGSGYGGTGITTYAKGDILYASATNTLSKLNAGTDGQVLMQQGGVPVWADLDGGTY